MENARQIHIRYDGRSLDIDCDVLDVGTLSTDNAIKEAVATHLDVPLVKLRDYHVDRHEETGSLTLRPQAVFG